MFIKLGQKFSSYNALHEYLKRFQEENNVQIYKSDGRKLASKNVQEKYIIKAKKASKELIYYNLTYKCIKGGTFKTRADGKRRSKTFRQGCPFLIKLGVSKNGKFLVVNACINEHNHEVSKELYQILPRQRRLKPEEEKEVSLLLNLIPDKKFVKGIIKKNTGKLLSSKDLNNLKARQAALKRDTTKSDLHLSVEFLSTVDDSVVEVVVNGDELEGIYFQTGRMRRAFTLYPEVLLCDSTYNLHSISMHLYIFLIINGNGESEVACCCLLVYETTSSFTQMLQIFKQHNPSWSDIETVVTDNEFKEREVFRTELPSANLALCIFHTLKTLKKNITREKMALTNDEVYECLQIMENMAYAATEEEYYIFYGELKRTHFVDVINYFEKNWHDIRNEWVEGLLMKNTKTLNITTTNHLTSFNGKIKQIASKNGSILQFSNDLVTVLDSMFETKKINASKILDKRHSDVTDENQWLYQTILTPFAFKIVTENLEKAKLMFKLDEEYNTSLKNCHCLPFKNFTLPCEHMFLKRILEGLPLFEEFKIPKRFYMSTYRELYACVNDSVTTTEVIPKEGVPTTSRIETPLSTTIKYNTVKAEFDDVCNIISQYNSANYMLALEEVKKFCKMLKNGSSGFISFKRTSRRGKVKGRRVKEKCKKPREEISRKEKNEERSGEENSEERSGEENSEVKSQEEKSDDHDYFKPVTPLQTKNEKRMRKPKGAYASIMSGKIPKTDDEA